MSNLLNELLMNTLMAYARTDKKNPWDEYADLIMKPSVMDKIIEVLKQESAEQKEQRINKQRADQRAYEKQRARRVRENKRQHGLITEEEEEEKKNEEEKKEEHVKSNLENLKKAGKDISEHLEHGEDKRVSFFVFQEPAPGCKYDIGAVKGHVIVPLDQTDLSVFLTKIHEYVYLILGQLFDNINRMINFNIVSVSDWLQFDSDGISTVIPRSESTKYYNLSARNQLMSICDQILEELTTKLEVPQKRSGLSFKQGVLIKLGYRTYEGKVKKAKKNKNKGGKYNDHQDVICFTSEIRKDDIKKMYNYIMNNKVSTSKGKCKGKTKNQNK